MGPASALSRIAAAAIAISAWLGILIELRTVMANGTSLAGALWAIFGYFTIITNFLVAIVFSHIAITGLRPKHSWSVGGLALSIMLVGVVFALLLQGLRELQGAGLLADFLLHRLNPVLVPLFWLLFVPRNMLTFGAPFQWMLYPLLYFAYGIIRGRAQGFYAYPFIDVGDLGWPRVLFNAVMIAVGFLVVGAGMVWLDRRIAAPAAPE
ncbi:hypothetical protein LCM4573_13150 [Rhizobium sp. LCM 4573]|nr:hypothetical protein LCM4573_13150 [Rhizobium sp. LCM 4573]